MNVTDGILPCGLPASGRTGDCSPEQHRSLQNAVNSACKRGKRACNRAQDCATLLKNIGKNKACADARTTINTTCYGGGDVGHRQAVTEALNAMMNCQKFFDLNNCRPKPEPVPVPAPAPEEDSEFMRRMAELTGLTGTALVLYIIVSELSRLFPPRNLVPVP